MCHSGSNPDQERSIQLLLASAALLALLVPARAAVVDDLGVNPTSSNGAFSNRNLPTGSLSDQYTFQLIGAPQFVRLPTCIRRPVTSSPTSKAPYLKLSGLLAALMTFWVLGPALAVPGNCGANGQVFGGSATLDPGNYYLNITGFAGSTAGYARATVAPRSPSFVERKSASGHSHQPPKGRLRQLWGSAPAPLRACAHHHSSWVALRLRFNLPQPGVSIIRAAPQTGCACPGKSQITRAAMTYRPISVLFAVNIIALFGTVAKADAPKEVKTEKNKPIVTRQFYPHQLWYKSWPGPSPETSREAVASPCWLTNRYGRRCGHGRLPGPEDSGHCLVLHA